MRINTLTGQNFYKNGLYSGFDSRQSKPEYKPQSFKGLTKCLKNKIYIDGQKVSKDQIVSIGDDALLGVYITAGEHTVSFKYVPQGLLLGCSISALTIVIFLLLISIIKSGLFNFNPPLYVEEPEEIEPVLEEENNDENEEGFKELIEKLSVDVSVTETATEESDAE